jgi:tetratricopeptide (TPR) repeat protein
MQLQEQDTNIDLWMGYCAFHQGNYKKALTIYENLLKSKPDSDNVAVNLACCYFYLGMYDESKEILQKAPTSGLKTRLNFHLSHKLRDEAALMEHHEQLQDVLEDQLSLAAIHYLRAHYQEAIDIYKRLLLQNRINLALNVYVALCYYKLDYYDVSQEVLTLYLNQYPDSVIATNLKVRKSRNKERESDRFSGVQPFSTVQRLSRRERVEVHRRTKRQRGLRVRSGQTQSGRLQRRRRSHASVSLFGRRNPRS